MSDIHQDKIIYICIGNTGTGKSTLVKSLGSDVPSSELVRSGDSLTTDAKFYRLRQHPTVLLVDTPGFRDSQSSYGELAFSDSEHMKEILNAFVRAEATHFNGVYWFVNESRKNDELRAQARFIDNLVNPEIDTPVADRSLGWKHVMVLIHGNVAVGTAVESIVKTEIGNTAVARSLQLRRVGLLLDGEDPGRCDLKIEGRTLQDSEHYEIFELQDSSRSMVLNDWFRDKDPIQWISTKDKCLDCLQRGDRRAFGRCHGPISRIHREGTKHVGVQFLVHGPKDKKEKTISILKKTAVALGVLGGATGTALTAAVTVLVPNPGTFLLCGTLLHMTVAAIAITAGASATSAATYKFKGTVVDPRRPSEKVSAGDAGLTEKQLKELYDTLEDFKKIRGKCAACGSDKDQEGCTYIWSCFLRSSKKDGPSNDRSSPMCDPWVNGCENFCRNKDCHQQLHDDKRVPGCLNKCTNCSLEGDQPDFAHRGCRDRKHRFEQ